VGRTSEAFYLDVVDPGQTFAYSVIAVNSDESLSTRSITEYGKTLMPTPENVTAEAKKNIVKLSWDAVKNASAYNVYRDGELLNSTSENSFSDFKLEYGTKFAYTIATLDHQSDPGSKTENVFVTTHLEIAKPKRLKAESGENQVLLNWKVANNSVKYYIYQNSVLIDSATSLSTSVKTEAGTENCFSVAGVDQYGSIGPKSDAACDKSVFSAPDSIVVSFDKRNNHLIKWSAVEGASSYNFYTNGKLKSNTEKLEIKSKRLKWDTDYSYYLTSLTDDGIEGPKSSDYTVRTPKIYFIEGLLLDETGDAKNVDQAKVFLYDSIGTTLLEEFVVARNGKFRFEKEIIADYYIVRAYGNGNGNGGDRVQVINKDITSLRINLSTEGLRPNVWVERGVKQLTVHWSDIPQGKSYNVYKNDRLIQNLVGDTSHVDIVAPGVPIKYMVRSIDIYDLEGPESNHVTETASFKHPELTPLVVSGVYTKDGSGRHINLSWQPVASVNNYALYRDGTLLSKQAETTYEDTDTKYATTYIYEINSIDNDNIEGVNSPKIPVNTHIEVLVPNFKLTPVINAISLDWPSLETSVNYKIFRNGSNIADTPDTSFIDNVKPGKEYCYSVAAEDNYQTVGPKADIQCGKAYFAPPGNFNGQVIRNEVSLSWTAILGASGYHLYRNNELIFETIDATEFLDEGLEFDSVYTYEICSHDQDVYEGPKVVVQIKTHEEVLGTDVTGESDLQKISLSWKKSILVAEHRYRIYRDAELLDETTDTSYQDFVPAGQFFCYIITVVDHYGTESEKSNEECDKVLVACVGCFI
jgi:fibronectin type 3 domain-containing protein